MNKFLEIIHGARKMEWLLLLVGIALLAMQFTGVSGGNTDLEERLTEVLRDVDGVGRIRVMVMEDSDGAPSGVLIVADGANNIGVRLRLQAAVQTLLGIELSRVEVIQYEK